MPKAATTSGGRKRRHNKAEDVKEEKEGDVRWEWEGDGGKWSIYSDTMGQQISRAFRADQATASLSLTTGSSLLVDLASMTQKDLQTGNVTRVRSAVREGEDYYVWQWQDDTGAWQPYTAGTTLLLERARREGGGSVSVRLGRTPYLLDLSTMRQVNSHSKYQRPLNRRLSDALETPDTLSDCPSASDGVCEPESVLGEEEEAEAGAGKRSRTSSRRGKRATAGQKSETEEGRKETEARRREAEAGSSGESRDVVKTVIVRGKAAVDTECKAQIGKAHVYSAGSEVFDAVLNQTNLQFNNNKFYIIQLLQENSAGCFSVWMRWGRVGKVGQSSLVPCGNDLNKAKSIFEKKFLDKTKNEWSERGNFEKVEGKYDMVKLDYSLGDGKGDEEQGRGKVAGDQERVTPDCRLDRRVQELLQLICDLQAMEETVLEMKYDIKKAPLGKLTGEQVKMGYVSLKRIEDCLNRKATGRQLVEACNEFYTRIPHDFGLKTPPLIRTKKELQEKVTLLEALSDIEIAIKLVTRVSDTEEHPLDTRYHSLHCDLQPLQHSSDTFQVIKRYLSTTHAPTHSDYSMELLEVFQVEREGERESFCFDLDNRLLLWHGSRLSNWAGILKQGLRIAPPEAPVTGYMFGKGIYFADMSSKSANYCFTTREKSVGLVLLCEVALGDSNRLLEADYRADQLPPGKHSTIGLGRVAPNLESGVCLDGAVVPAGPGTETGVRNSNRYTLNYNEYIVYNADQVRMKYLLKIHFKYDSLW